ncbi:MAG TPA: hypothetical protein VG275_06995 [Solirubrobacteraceae bacterium]|jgi:hypothetical protein|nr:hypothetical protein [Solirubrobacteraceae bacterium]
MSASLTDLSGFAARVLSAFDAQLAQQGVSLPSRQYVTPGSMVPWDGEQLTVSLMGIDQGRPGGTVTTSIVPQATIFYASFSVNLIRAIPTINTEGFSAGETPTAEDLGASGGQLLDDAAQLVLAASAFHQAYLLSDPGVDFVVGPLSPVGPEGGLAGSRMLLSLSLS